MPTFSYEAVDNAGRAQKGAIEAKSVDDARDKLKGKGFFPTSIAQKGGKARKSQAAAAAGERQKTFTIGSGVSQSEVTLFTRQFATLVDAGLPMVRALDIMEQMLKPGGLRNVLMDVRDEVEQGSSLSEAMAKSPAAFDELYVSMIRAGELGGLLAQILNRLAEFREKSMRLKKQIIGALIYPAAVITIAGGILALIIAFIVPKFRKMFEEMKIPLPSITQALMTMADFLVNYWYIAILSPFIAIGSFVGIRSTQAGRYAIDMMSLYLPVFGVIIKKSSISRFCRTLGELSSAGVPILDALGLIKNAVGNMVVAAAVEDIHSSIREGENIADPMRRSGVFDIMVVNMVEVGEETGELDKMLVKIADTYDNDVDTLVGSMMSLLEPFLIIGMGLAVGFIVIALFLPLIAIIEGIQ
ncbi:MAG: type II secretion system F family protein [Planctomycetes bacterium]|nr:type II secretion system F family protein [Planctomycetota bacterium]